VLIFWMSRITADHIHRQQVEVAGARDYILRGALTIRGVSREVEAQGQLPCQGELRGGKRRTEWIDKVRGAAGFVAKTRITATISASVGMMSVTKRGRCRHTIDITIDAEAILE